MRGRATASLLSLIYNRNILRDGERIARLKLGTFTRSGEERGKIGV